MRIFLFTAVWIATCWAQKIDTEFDKALDFSQFKTFTIREGKLTAKDPLLSSELVEKNLRMAIVEQLKGKGLNEVESNADLNVTFRLTGGTGKQQVLAPGQTMDSIGPRGRVTERTTRPRKTSITQAKDTLVIDLRNTATKELAWRAVCVDQQDDPAKLEKHLAGMIIKAFQKYPPKKK